MKLVTRVALGAMIALEAQEDRAMVECVLDRNDKRWRRLRKLIRNHSLRVGDFKLSSCRHSTYLFQVRQTTMLPEGAALLYYRRDYYGRHYHRHGYVYPYQGYAYPPSAYAYPENGYVYPYNNPYAYPWPERIFVFVAACHVRAKSLSLVGGGTAYLNIELKDLGRPQPRANRKQISTSQILISATAEISARP